MSQEDLIEAAAVSMPDYVEPFFVHVLDGEHDRRPGVLSVTALLAVWAAGKAIQYLEAGLNGSTECTRREDGWSSDSGL